VADLGFIMSYKSENYINSTI